MHYSDGDLVLKYPGQITPNFIEQISLAQAKKAVHSLRNKLQQRNIIIKRLRTKLSRTKIDTTKKLLLDLEENMSLSRDECDTLEVHIYACKLIKNDPKIQTHGLYNSALHLNSSIPERKTIVDATINRYFLPINTSYQSISQEENPRQRR